LEKCPPEYSCKRFYKALDSLKPGKKKLLKALEKGGVPRWPYYIKRKNKGGFTDWGKFGDPFRGVAWEEWLAIERRAAKQAMPLGTIPARHIGEDDWAAIEYESPGYPLMNTSFANHSLALITWVSTWASSTWSSEGKINAYLDRAAGQPDWHAIEYLRHVAWIVERGFAPAQVLFRNRLVSGWEILFENYPPKLKELFEKASKLDLPDELLPPLTEEQAKLVFDCGCDWPM
jgi:hypothetical protein